MTRRILTVAALLVPVVALLVAGFTVVVPFVAMGPGPTVNTLGEADIEVTEGGQTRTATAPVVDVCDAAADPTSGNLNMTTVAVRDQITLFEAIGLWASGDNGIVPRDEVYQPGKSKEEIQEENSADFLSSESSAQMAALSFLDKPFTLAPAVASVIAGGPADGLLESQDVLLTVDGAPMADPAAISAAVAAKAPGDVVAIEYRRGCVTDTAEITLGANPNADQKNGYLGIMLTEAPVSDVKVTFNLAGIGGPSAGLMFSLALVDKLSPGELTGGEFIAGTGTIDQDGKVGPIGGITYKMAAAREAGASVFLVPTANCAEAARHAPDGLELVKVDSLEGAIVGLAAVTGGGQAPRC